MEFEAAISEPLARLITFHNAFNRNIKLSFGALALLSEQFSSGNHSGAFELPTGTEPWGRETRWRSLDTPLRDSAIFLSELGIARAAAAFEDYTTGAKGEFDRASLVEVGAKKNGVPALHGFDAIVGVETADIADVVRMAEFFDVARNCVVHRSNRASAQLATMRSDSSLLETLKRWPKRVGRWTVSLPPVVEGRIVEWRPRHAILSSDVFYRAAVTLDRALVRRMGAGALVRMAAHWCFFADPAAPCEAKHSPETMIRSQLTDRYKVRDLTLADTITLLRSTDRWDAVRAAWSMRFPDGPETTLARRRRARRAGR
jgi:hypothetical protein